jgi:hypothetical protein
MQPRWQRHARLARTRRHGLAVWVHQHRICACWLAMPSLHSPCLRNRAPSAAHALHHSANDA